MGRLKDGLSRASAPRAPPASRSPADSRGSRRAIAIAVKFRRTIEISVCYRHNIKLFSKFISKTYIAVWSMFLLNFIRKSHDRDLWLYCIHIIILLILIYINTVLFYYYNYNYIYICISIIFLHYWYLLPCGIILPDNIVKILFFNKITYSIFLTTSNEFITLNVILIHYR